MRLHQTYIHVLHLWRPEEDIRFPSTGVTDGCELPFRSCESNLDPGSKPAEPSLQLPIFLKIIIIIIHKDE